jgi:hypothetical protein
LPVPIRLMGFWCSAVLLLMALNVIHGAAKGWSL